MKSLYIRRAMEDEILEMAKSYPVITLIIYTLM